MGVPNNEQFSLLDVINELGGGETSLQSCFNNANSGSFDPTYNNDTYAPANSLLRFRNYQSSQAWDITGTSSLSATFSLPTVNRGLIFRNDGLRFFTASQNKVSEWTLTTAWDISTASILNIEHSTPAVPGATDNLDPQTLFISPDGTRVYIPDDVVPSGGRIYQFALGVPWDFTTMTYITQVNIATQTTVVTSMVISPDGLNMMVGSGSTIYEYTLGTAWSINTATYDNKSLSGLTSIFGTTWRPNGERIYYSDNSQNPLVIAQRSYTGSFDLSTPTGGEETYTSTISDTCRAIFFRPTGLRYYINGFGSIYQLDI